MKTSELTGAALDWVVAKCEGKSAAQIKNNGPVHLFRTIGYHSLPWQPSTDWSQGGPIIEREEIFLQPTDGAWFANLRYCNDESKIMDSDAYGDTPLIAAMRCYVASKLGDEVEIPEELK